MTVERLKEIIDDCKSALGCSNSNFNKWEEDFILNIEDKIEEFGSLTPKQMEKLLQIWDKI